MLASPVRVASSDVPVEHCLEDDSRGASAGAVPGALQFDSAVFRGRRTAMNHLIIEVRAAEGGDDAKALVGEQVAIYTRLASRRCL
jgi:protein subunit release factor A